VEVDGNDTVRVGAAVAGTAEAGALTGLGVQPENKTLNMVARINRTTIWLLICIFMNSLPFHSFPPLINGLGIPSTRPSRG